MPARRGDDDLAAQVGGQVGDESVDPGLFDAGHADDASGVLVATEDPGTGQWSGLGEGDGERVRESGGGPADAVQRFDCVGGQAAGVVGAAPVPGDAGGEQGGGEQQGGVPGTGAMARCRRR